MALFSATNEHWVWLSMPAVSAAWSQVQVGVEWQDLLSLLKGVSCSPLDVKPGEPFPPGEPGSVVRKAQGYGIEITFSVVPRAEMAHGLRLVDVRSVG